MAYYDSSALTVPFHYTICQAWTQIFTTVCSNALTLVLITLRTQATTIAVWKPILRPGNSAWAQNGCVVINSIKWTDFIEIQAGGPSVATCNHFDEMLQSCTAQTPARLANTWGTMVCKHVLAWIYTSEEASMANMFIDCSAPTIEWAEYNSSS